jgi:hypothetical protein
MMPIISVADNQRPDICALQVFDEPLLVAEGKSMPLASLTIVEIKRPMRNDVTLGEEKNPIEQCLGYLQRIREGHTQTANGRPIPSPETIPGFCYILADLTPSLEKYCKMFGRCCIKSAEERTSERFVCSYGYGVGVS